MGRTYIGTAGFSYKDWQGTFYPRGMKRSQHPLSYYARYFDCCEINTSFYGHLKPEWAKKWCDYLYTEKEVADWSKRVEEMSGRAEKTFVITNNHYKGQAAANALEIKQLLTGENVGIPPQLVETYPVLRKYAKVGII